MSAQTDRFVELLEQRRLIVCCGSGGVGKTTVAASLALRAAELGRRALVLTVDPARRLATCLGMDAIGWQPHRVALDDCPGQLWAMMLDTRAMFDDLVHRLAPDVQTANRITHSRLYSVFAGTMHGTPEYMALESLHNVYHDARIDLVVLDTPPLTNALEFFTVPQRASWMFDERVMRWFVPQLRPKGLRGRLHPGGVVLSLVGSLAGRALVDSLVEFFTALDVIRGSLQQRGLDVAKILQAPDTAYVIVTGAHARRVREAVELARQLGELKQPVEAFVVNRSHHCFDSGRPASSDATLTAELSRLGVPEQELSAAVADLRRLHQLMVASGRRHGEQIAKLAEHVGADRLLAVPDLVHDIHDLSTLSVIGRRLVGAMPAD